MEIATVAKTRLEGRRYWSGPNHVNLNGVPFGDDNDPLGWMDNAWACIMHY